MKVLFFFFLKWFDGRCEERKSNFFGILKYFNGQHGKDTRYKMYSSFVNLKLTDHDYCLVLLLGCHSFFLSCSLLPGFFCYTVMGLCDFSDSVSTWLMPSLAVVAPITTCDCRVVSSPNRLFISNKWCKLWCRYILRKKLSKLILNESRWVTKDQYVNRDTYHSIDIIEIIRIILSKINWQ
jgi:hypothetical protein